MVGALITTNIVEVAFLKSICMEWLFIMQGNDKALNALEQQRWISDGWL
jgi:hypothetical protein